MPPRDTVTRPLLLIAGLFAIAANLRAPITGVAPLLDTLQAVFGLSPAQAGLLTTLPLLAFGIVSPLAATLARRVGLEGALSGALLLITAGLLARIAGPVAGVYAGTLLIGAGIAVGNVLLPSLVKRSFPSRVPTLTGLCALSMGIAAALLSASAVPLGTAFGWQAALGLPLVLSLGALGLWQQAPRPAAGAPSGTPAAGPDARVWRSALAWQVTLFMGINSLLYYVLIAWLPSILTEAGLSPTLAGSLHGMMQLASAIPGLVLGPIVTRMKDQRLIAAALGALIGLSLLGFCLHPAWASLWAFGFGLGSGGSLILALIFMGLRATSPQQAAALSGMAQCVGYLLAACGPTLVGKLHEVTGSWTPALSIGVGLAVLMGVFGVLAGRARHIAG
ncbi:MAG: MFS transporter [Proteobacteria bacterium]|nr:MFS transporter [Pseudomonadota bacterium]